MKMYGNFLIVLFLSLFINGASADIDTKSAETLNPSIINKILDKTEREFKRKSLRLDKLGEFFEKIKIHRAWAISCVTEKESSILEIASKIKSLGEKVKGETLSVSKKRTDLFKQEVNLKKYLANCKVILLRTDELSNKINLVKQKKLAKQLLSQGKNFFSLIENNWDNPSLLTQALKKFVFEHSGLLDLKITDISILAILLVVVFLISHYYSIKITTWTKDHTPRPLLASQLSCALITTAERYIKFAPAILFAVAYVNFLNLGITPKPFVVIVLNGLAIVIAINIIIHFFLNSSLSIYKHEPKTKQKAINLVHRLKVLGAIIFFGYLLFSTLFFHDMPEAILLISRGIYGTLFILNIVWVIWLLGYFHKIGNKLIVRTGLTLIFILALVAEWMGYRNLSLYIIEVVIGSLFLLGFYSVLSILISEFMDSLDKGSIPFALRVRNWLGVGSDKRIQGLIWVRLIISLTMWIGFVSLMIFIWQIPDTYTELLISKIIEGVTIGSVQLIPIQIFEAIVVFSVILLLNSWFKRRLEKNWLPKTNMTRSARESMTTVSGYLGILIAFIFALSFIGMDFSKLAIVAGALSVGIGFGLQNVVNNFISGLILLFERPIKTGDWIVVGQTEGNVKRISIRSTHIQTFDRADVIVPNSEIISGTVTNWMLRDHSGRVRVPIGVAYGSNTNLVRDLLLQIAQEHSDVIKNNAVISDPVVYFMAFGASSLDFELRCHVYNIDNRRRIISDLNFAIDRVFRENNISIPFPQREIHITQNSDKPKNLDDDS
ncbi:Potassium efflux system KefA protein / Small-conductance mechanosensitive channel [hydrothermal vent metagenome]|uniref:Potassium efflux system KefA protein / Small-conductance mechanosensitive channel n=1 Tax=hydrothermal vent metagenome TaxID=652676 RepID=A0A3B1B9E1_9ZZZZ